MIYFLKVLEFKMAIIFAKKRHNTGFVVVTLNSCVATENQA